MREAVGVLGGSPRPPRRLPAAARHEDPGAAHGAPQRERPGGGALARGASRRCAGSGTRASPSHPDHAVATRLMSGFGGVVTFELEADLEATIRFTDACRMPYIAPSLGGVESLIEMPVAHVLLGLSAGGAPALRHHRLAGPLLLRHRGRRRPDRRPRAGPGASEAADVLNVQPGQPEKSNVDTSPRA